MDTTTNTNETPKRRLEDRTPAATIDWEAPDAPAVPANLVSASATPLRPVASLLVNADGISVFPTPAAKELPPGHYMLSALGAGPQASAPEVETYNGMLKLAQQAGFVSVSAAIEAAKLARATALVRPVPDPTADEAKLFRDLTGDAMKLGFDGIDAALAALRRAAATSGDAPTDDDLQQLKALALAATPGPWANWGRHVIPQAHFQRRLGGSTDPVRDKEDYAHLICRVDGKHQPDDANAAFIAAANPAVVLDLIARIECTERERDNWKFVGEEFLNKTEWVQKEVQGGMLPASSLGRHRADIILEEVTRLRAARIERAAAPADVARRQAPWRDFAGNPIHEGDTVEHPSGQRGTVMYVAGISEGRDPWRVAYSGGDTSALALQIGEKGRAVVVSSQHAAAPATASGDLPDALRRLSERLKWMLDADQFRNVEAMLSAISATAAPATIIPDALYESVKGMQDAAYTFGDNCQEAVRVALDGVLDVMREFDAGVVHPDDAAVDRFAAAMKEKMAKSRAKGRGGWEDPAQCSVEALQSMLLGHLDKGDPVDVGNFAMMLWSRGASVSAATKPTAEQIADAIEHLIGNHVMDWHAGPTGDPEEDAFHSDDHERAVLVDAVNKALAAKRAATKPAPIDMSELRKLAWTRTGMDENSASTEYFYRAADVQSLLATRPAAPTVPEDWSDTLNEVADLLMERNWRGDLAETLRDFAKCAAPAATPAPSEYRKLTGELSLNELAAEFCAVTELGGDVTLSAGACRKLFDAMTTPPAATPAAQDQADQAHVMPPFAAPASQHGAWIATRDQLPEKACLAVYETAHGKQRIIRAKYVERYTVEAVGDECYSEINDANDTDYLREGWYELVDNWDEYASVHVCEGVVTHWMPLPPTPDQPEASRCRAQGGNTQADSAQAAPAASADAVVDARNQALDEAIEAAKAERVRVVGACSESYNEGVNDAISAIRNLKSSSGVLRTGEGAGNAN